MADRQAFEQIDGEVGIALVLGFLALVLVGLIAFFVAGAFDIRKDISVRVEQPATQIPAVPPARAPESR